MDMPSGWIAETGAAWRSSALLDSGGTSVQQIATSTVPAKAFQGLLSTRQIRLPKARQEKTMSVHLAECEDLRSQASILVNRMYAWRGYGDEHKMTSGEHRATFTACTDEQVIGTLTLTVDTVDGLATDHTFSAELDDLRETAGTVLCDLTKLAVDPSTKSPAVLAGLFHVIFLYGIRVFGCTDVVIEVHPRHVRYYEAMLGFKRVGAPKIDASVEWWPSDTPVQLMCLNLSDMRRLIEISRGDSRSDARSLYPHFFSREEEFAIAGRIARMNEAAPLRADRAATAKFATPDYWRAAA
jgi:hypothetical protein